MIRLTSNDTRNKVMEEVYFNKRKRRDMHEFLRRTRQDIINARIDPDAPQCTEPEIEE